MPKEPCIVNGSNAFNNALDLQTSNSILVAP